MIKKYIAMGNAWQGIKNVFAGPVFLIGMPRSGTKLLRAILNRNRRVAIPDIETEFLPYLKNKLERRGVPNTIEEFCSFYNSVVTLPFFIYLKKEGRCPECQEWFDSVRDYTVAGVFEALIRCVVNCDVDSDCIWGDKSPSYIYFLPEIAKMFPEARFIHIVRDVRDYCLSINRAWGKNMVRAAHRWALGMQVARQFMKEFPGMMCEVYYEDLVSDPVGTVSNICDFLDLEYHDEMISLDRSVENIGDAKGVPGIVKDNINKYRNAISLDDLRKIEEAAFSSMIMMGYQPDVATRQKTPGIVSLLFLQLSDAVSLVLSDRKEMGMWGALNFHIFYKRATSGRW